MMTRPPLENVRDELVKYILHLEDKIHKLQTENAQLKRQASLKQMKTSINKKNTPPSSNGHNYPIIGINVDPI